MNLSLRRRQGNHMSKETSVPGNRPNISNNGGAQDRKNIVSMINPQPGQVQWQTVPENSASRVLNFTLRLSFFCSDRTFKSRSKSWVDKPASGRQEGPYKL